MENLINPDRINEFSNTKPRRSPIGAFIWYLSFLFIFPLFIHISNINKLKKLRVKVSEAQSGIDIQLKRRRDTLVKLIDAVKGSLKFEKETLMNLTSMRTGNSIEESNRNAGMLNKIAKDVTIQLENYPDLKSTSLIQDLMQTTTDVEEDIAASRRIYNSNVSIFNQSLDVFPMNAAAAQLKYVFIAMFEALEYEKADVAIEF